MGHNKGWEEAASMFSGDSVVLKTCNAALLEAAGKSWVEVSIVLMTEHKYAFLYPLPTMAVVANNTNLKTDCASGYLTLITYIRLTLNDFFFFSRKRKGPLRFISLKR
jgi:hypothetical protein